MNNIYYVIEIFNKTGKLKTIQIQYKSGYKRYYANDELSKVPKKIKDFCKNSHDIKTYTDNFTVYTFKYYY